MPGSRNASAVLTRLAGRADQHALGAAVEMRLRAGARGGAAGAIDHQVDAERAPIRQLLHRVVVGDLAPADHKAGLGGLDLFVPAAIVGVDLEQRREGRDVADIGDRDRREQVVLQRDLGDRAADAPEAVNSYACHTVSLLSVYRAADGSAPIVRQTLCRQPAGLSSVATICIQKGSASGLRSTRMPRRRITAADAGLS